jgi:hypothetical protein
VVITFRILGRERRVAQVGEFRYSRGVLIESLRDVSRRMVTKWILKKCDVKM